MAKANSSKAARKAARKAAGNKTKDMAGTRSSEDIRADLMVLFEAVRAHGIRLTETFQNDTDACDVAIFPKLIADRGEALIVELALAKEAA